VVVLDNQLIANRYNGRRKDMKLTADRIMSVYSGQDGKCCCGCAGKHYYNPEFQKQGSRYRGYKVDDNELSIKMVNKVIGILNRSNDVEDLGSCFSTVIGKRLYIAYLLMEVVN
jgi:hypothetical protein